MPFALEGIQLNEHARGVSGIQKDQFTGTTEADFEASVDVAPDIDRVYEAAL